MLHKLPLLIIQLAWCGLGVFLLWTGIRAFWHTLMS
jgi:hypothetical protein